MGKDKKTLSSLADLAALVKSPGGGKSPKQVKGKAADFRPAAIRHEDVADIEATFLAEAKAKEAAPAIAGRRVIEVQQAGRNKRKLVELSRPTPEQVAADIAAYKSTQHIRDARETEKREHEERLAQEAARAAAQAAAQMAKIEAIKAEKVRLQAEAASLAAAAKAAATSASLPLPTANPPAPTKKDVLPAVRKVFAELPPPIETRPRSVQGVTRTPVEGFIARGAELFARRPGPDHSGYIIGCDFGTSCVKIVVRQPYSASDPAARPAPSALQSRGHPYLWQTVVWFDPQSKQFSLLPSKGAVALEGFKAGILAGEGGKRVVPDLPITRREAAAAFLALQLSHCLGWYDIERPLGEQGADHFLAINVGIPVAAQDDARTYRDFNHVVSTAGVLISEASNLTHGQVRAALQASADSLPDGFELIPELAAAIYGYANGSFARLGSHVMIDVGASTLDIVAFILHENDEKKIVSALAAEVDLLGAAALAAAKQAGFNDQLFRGACIGLFDDVFHYARRDDVAPLNFDEARRSKPVQLIVVGGGSKTEVHKDMIGRVHPCLGDLKILSPEPPLLLPAGPCDTSRLLLAFGLTADIPEQLELRRPSAIVRIAPMERSAVSFISKDQM